MFENLLSMVLNYLLVIVDELFYWGLLLWKCWVLMLILGCFILVFNF